jgi:hypothetical protein
VKPFAHLYLGIGAYSSVRPYLFFCGAQSSATAFYFERSKTSVNAGKYPLTENV